MQLDPRTSTGGGNGHVIDADEATFASAVLEESARRPVVVDFWAGWCQPCRTIGPVLERLAVEHGGAFLLAKVDVDANPRLSQAFRIQSIPAVKAFADGRVVDEFVGAIPEPSIRGFVSRLLPTEADTTAAQAEAEERAGRTDLAERLYEQALRFEAKHVRATLGLARLAALRGDLDRAGSLLEPLRPNAEAERLLAAIEVSRWPAAGGDGPIAVARRAAAEGRYREALAALMSTVSAGGAERDEARESMLKLFAVLGESDPLTVEYRRRLAAALF